MIVIIFKINFAFLRLCGLLDIYKLLSDISRNCQQSKVFVWTVLHHNDELLQEMSVLGTYFSNFRLPIATTRATRSYFDKAATCLSTVFQDETPGTSASCSTEKPYLCFKRCKIYKLWPYDEEWEAPENATDHEGMPSEDIDWKNLYVFQQYYEVPFKCSTLRFHC